MKHITDPRNAVTAQRRLAGIYLKISDQASSSDERQKLLKLAKTVYLQSCVTQSSVHAWLGVGLACYHMGEFSEAEDALTEANAVNPKDGDVWAMIAVLCLKLGRTEETHLAIAQAKHLRVSQVHLIEYVCYVIIFIFTYYHNTHYHNIIIGCWESCLKR